MHFASTTTSKASCFHWHRRFRMTSSQQGDCCDRAQELLEKVPPCTSEYHDHPFPFGLQGRHRRHSTNDRQSQCQCFFLACLLAGEDTPGIGLCGWLLTMISWGLVMVTLPFSLFVCFKVRKTRLFNSCFFPIGLNVPRTNTPLEYFLKIPFCPQSRGKTARNSFAA